MQSKKFKPIKTKRLDLKPLKATFTQAQELVDLIKRNREHFKWLIIANVKAPEEEYDWLKTAVQQRKDSKAAHYVIYLHSTNKIIGLCGIDPLSWGNSRGEIGYWLDQDYTGYGYMTEAVKALEDAFFGMGLNRLSIRANVKNKASCGVAKRLGYKKEGVVRAELFNKVMNEYEDIAYYGKLRSEWKGKK